MKTWLYILTTLLALTLLGTLASDTSTNNNIFDAIENVNTEELSFYFNQSVNLTIFDKSGLYGKKQAEVILNNFFTGNEITDIEIIQKKDQQNFCSAICKVNSLNNKSYILHLTYFNVNNQNLITDISIKNN